jgi:histidyl-tRNA synthetase
MGNERLIALMREAQARAASGVTRHGARGAPHAYVVHQGEGTGERAFALAEELRSRSYRAVLHAGGGSFKSQMKKADSSGALFAVILGEEELKANEVTFKYLREEAEQVRVKPERLSDFMAEALRDKVRDKARGKE